jgi:hypothetical protein
MDIELMRRDIYTDKYLLGHAGLTILAHAGSTNGPCDCSEHSHEASGDRASKRSRTTKGESICPVPPDRYRAQASGQAFPPVPASDLMFNHLGLVGLDSANRLKVENQESLLDINIQGGDYSR